MRIHIDINFKLKPKHKAIIIITDNGCIESWYYLKDISEWIRQKYLRSIFNKRRRDRAYEKLFALKSVQEQIGAGYERYKQQKGKEKQWLLRHNL